MHDSNVQTLLFYLAKWHVLAKLRLYAEDSLALLQQALWQLGAEMQRFQHVTCPAFDMKELPCETAQRHQRETVALLSGCCQKSIGSLSLQKVFNTNTYKFHALGNYEQMIRHYGTMDAYYMTQVVSFNTLVFMYHIQY